MKMFIRKVFLFTVSIGSFLVLINILFLESKHYDPFWGNELFQNKLKDLNSHKTCNTLFLGSSHFYRHVNPMIFDSVTQSGNSYNLGVPGLATPENYYLLDNLINDETIEVKNIFIALSRVQAIAPENYYSNRSVYFINQNIFKETISIIWDEEYKWSTKIFRSYSFLANYLFRSFGLPSIRNVIKNEAPNSNIGFKYSKGFLALDDEKKTPDLIDRKNNFEKNHFRLEERKITAIEHLSGPKLDYKINEAHLNKLNSLLKETEEKGIKLFFVLLPRKRYYEEEIGLMSQLPPSRIINLANPMLHPELYEFENSFDVGHLNKKGAKVFTQKLAEEFIKITKDN